MENSVLSKSFRLNGHTSGFYPHALGLKSKKYLNYCIQDSVNLSW